MKKKSIVFALFLAGAVILFAGCGIIKASHQASSDVVSRSFEPGDFNAINIGGPYEIIFRQSERAYVTIEVRESLFDILRVDVRGNALHVSTQANVTGAGNQKVYVYAPYLEGAVISGLATATDWDAVSGENFSLTASGSASIKIALDVENLSVNSSGSGTARLSGRSDVVDISRSGSGGVQAFDLQTKNAVVGSSGSGRVEISVSDSLDVTSSGSGSVRYRGNPIVSQRTSGSGTVSRVE